jgi:hypothetical protein
MVAIWATNPAPAPHFRPAYFTDHQPIRTHPRRLPNQVSKGDRPGELGVGWPTLDTHDMRVVGRQLTGILDDDDPLVWRYHRQECGQQYRLAVGSDTLCPRRGLTEAAVFDCGLCTPVRFAGDRRWLSGLTGSVAPLPKLIYKCHETALSDISVAASGKAY